MSKADAQHGPAGTIEPLYYLLSLKHSHPGAPLVWEKPGRKGYTFYMDEAGTFSPSDLQGWDGRGIDTGPARAIPVDAAEGRTTLMPPTLRRGTPARPGAPVVALRHLRALSRIMFHVRAG